MKKHKNFSEFSTTDEEEGEEETKIILSLPLYREVLTHAHTNEPPTLIQNCHYT